MTPILEPVYRVIRQFPEMGMQSLIHLASERIAARDGRQRWRQTHRLARRNSSTFRLMFHMQLEAEEKRGQEGENERLQKRNKDFQQT